MYTEQNMVVGVISVFDYLTAQEDTGIAPNTKQDSA